MTWSSSVADRPAWPPPFTPLVTERLDNFPGFPDGIAGSEFADRLAAQCRRFGVELLSAAEATSIAHDGQYGVVQLASGESVQATAALLAPGSTYKRLGVPGEDDLIGAGVHFCATCDGPFYRDEDVLVIGGGNSAAEEAVFLARFARQVTIVTRGPGLTASKVIQEKVAAHPKIAVRPDTEVAELRGDGHLESVVLRCRTSAQTDDVSVRGIFVFVGLQPNTGFLHGSITLTEAGFIPTLPTLQTSLPGVFAAGDARAGSTKQLVSAAGEGATAALMIRQYLEAHGDRPRPDEARAPAAMMMAAAGAALRS
jgi:thioredoxin reductase (NADPH)